MSKLFRFWRNTLKHYFGLSERKTVIDEIVELTHKRAQMYQDNSYTGHLGIGPEVSLKVSSILHDFAEELKFYR